MMNKKKMIGSVHQQQGSVLLWGLVILLTLTIISVAAARMGVTDTRLSSNETLNVLSYQGAEAALENAAAFHRVVQVIGGETSIVDTTTPLSNGVELRSRASFGEGERMSQCAAQEGYAVSVEMASEYFSCYSLKIFARGEVVGTGAKAEHTMGVMKYIPSSKDAREL